MLNAGGAPADPGLQVGSRKADFSPPPPFSAGSFSLSSAALCREQQKWVWGERSFVFHITFFWGGLRSVGEVTALCVEGDKGGGGPRAPFCFLKPTFNLRAFPCLLCRWLPEGGAHRAGRVGEAREGRH